MQASGANSVQGEAIRETPVPEAHHLLHRYRGLQNPLHNRQRPAFMILKRRHPLFRAIFVRVNHVGREPTDRSPPQAPLPWRSPRGS
jgi:hypothetical protein